MLKGKLFGMIAGGLGAALVLTACSSAVNSQQTVTGSNGMMFSFQGFTSAKTSQASLFTTQTREKADLFVVRAAEDAVAVPAKAAEQSKAVEQTRVFDQAMSSHGYSCGDKAATATDE